MKLEDFVGNQLIVQLMKNGHLPPACLFAGLGGIGKKTLALGLVVAHTEQGRVAGGGYIADAAHQFGDFDL